MTLAERYFAADKEWESVKDLLFDTITKILKPENEIDYPAVDVYGDEYDNSIEVILNPNAKPLNRESADKILALGFGCVYESHRENGMQWCKTYEGKCSPRKPRQCDTY